MKNGLLPRARYLTEPLDVAAKRPPTFDISMVGSLPDEITSWTGRILSTVTLQDGGIGLVLLLEAVDGTFVLRVAEGVYRSQELWAEHAAMQLVYGTSVPVPEPLALINRGDLSFGLRRYVAGEPLSLVMADESSRMEAIRQMGKLLASIHAIGPDPEWRWQDWVDSGLKLAAGNLAAGVCDPDEFTDDQPPSAALDWLIANQPSRSGSICLLHGDFRPKNMMWQNGKITGVIDWQFVDFGDPYYDLSVIHWYMHSEAEWQQLLAGYGLQKFDIERFEYCLVLQKFLNV